MSGANWSVMFCSVSESSSSAFTSCDSNCMPACGMAKEASFWRLLRRRALEAPLCGVPKKRMPNVQVYIECIWLIFEPSRLAEYARAY